MNGKQIQTVEANEALDNIKLYASLNYRDDKDQKLAFIIIASAFVVKLYDKVICNRVSRERNTTGELKIDFTKPVNVFSGHHQAILTD